jgi:hypothetical protein
MDDDKEEALRAGAEYLKAQTAARGVSAVTVADGVVWMFSVEALRGLLARAEAHEARQAVVFVKRSTPQDGN